MFLLVSFFILCNSKLHAPYISIQILPFRSPRNQLSYVDGEKEITVISHILQKAHIVCCLEQFELFDIASYDNMNTAWF